MHKPYELIFKHPCDFRVKYRLYDKSEGGINSLPFQGIRLDFWYDHPDHEIKGGFIIWPEFEDENGNIILDSQVLPQGFARMWIINEDLRPYHQKRIKPGIKGYFLEGHKIGECEVIEIIGLMTNPIN